MASRQTRQRRMQQLKENLAVRVSLLDRQVEELLSNLNSYHSEVKHLPSFVCKKTQTRGLLHATAVTWGWNEH